MCIHTNRTCSLHPACKNSARKFGVECVVESGIGADQSRLLWEKSVIFPVDKLCTVHGGFGV